jgi:hypothetical protein
MHTGTCAAPGSPGAAHYFACPLTLPAAGYVIFMSEDRITARADDLLPEERAAGSADPSAQAEAILEDSDEREYGEAEVREHRNSAETVTSDDTTR